MIIHKDFLIFIIVLKEEIESVTNCNKLRYKLKKGKIVTNALDIEKIMRLIKSNTSIIVEPIKTRLAKIGKEKM